MTNEPTAAPDSPDALRDALDAVAGNLSFTWHPSARALFAELDSALDGGRFDALDHNPTALLAELSDNELARALTPAYAERVARVREELAREAERATWWDRRDEDRRFLVAYFCCEFGLDESFPVYSGGLGTLAGDHLKSASELGVPLVAVGLLYREGYFRQELDESGRQVERYPVVDPTREPLVLEPETVTVELAGEGGALVPVRIQIWRAQVGRVALYLLDTDVDDNPDWARGVTDRLYGGDREHRIHQEIVLGVGGARALRALGIEPSVYHLNEGHSAFLQLERLRRLVEEEGVDRDAGRARLRAATVFTTHTPVPAGNEVFVTELVERNLAPLVSRCGLAWDEFAALGRIDHQEGLFGMTPFALRTSTHANGVSELHGEVSREMWSALWPGRAPDEVPIGSVTNAVHAHTWLSAWLTELLGTEEDTGAPDFADALTIDDGALWHAHRQAKEELLRVAHGRFERQHGGSRDVRFGLDPEALTIGFARRFATYKRADLLFSDTDRLARLLGDPERPLQIVLAGKAHPADEGGKDLLQRLVEFTRDPRPAGRVVFLEDYEMGLAR
ncbi:MAG TPA: alpha-glucan family phosphorylase, partial [Gaiellaceae bacterium]|nr:alpha-glucan family phosphorylase [Gaiellaceae bacterium]